MVYKRYIYRDGKRFGPYYYHTYRDKDGKTHSRYVSEEHEISAVTHRNRFAHNIKEHKTLFILLGAMLLIILAISFLSYQYSEQKISGTGDKGFSFGGFVKGIYSFVTGFTTEGSEPSAPDSSSDSGVSSSETAPSETPSETPTTEIPTETTPETTTEEQVPAENPTENNETIEQPNEETNQTTPETNETIVNETLQNQTTSGSETTGQPTTEETGESRGAVINGSNGSIVISNESISNETFIENFTNETIINETIVTNETISNQTANVTADISTKQYGAILGKPVKWEKLVKISIEGANKTDSLKIDLPQDAGNISVKKINELGEEELSPLIENEKKIEEVPPVVEKPANEPGGNFLTSTFNFFLGFFRGMTARVVDIGDSNGNVSVQINEQITENDEIVVEYYTNAPYSIEENLNGGKKVQVIGSESVHYENVLAFTELNESLKIKNPELVEIYWEENNTFVPIQSLEDRDGNGIYDYLEWVVPRLSNQTFRIIVITKAEHLDANKAFISDIYEEVKTLDGIWSETIPSEDYVRITFERNLTSDRDITIYPRVVSGTPKIEVYEENGTDIIAEFSSLDSEQYNKVYLTGLSGEQDTFDLRILNGDIEINHIVDPTGVCSGGTCVFDDSYVLADIYYSGLWKSLVYKRLGSQIKWNVSALCDAALSSVDSAILELSIQTKTGTPDNDATTWYINDQAWDETSSVGTIAGQTGLNVTAATLSSTTQGTRTNITVTALIQQACANGNSNATIRLEDADFLLGAVAVDAVSDIVYGIGYDGATDTLYYFSDRENATQSNRPKLYVFYTAVAVNVAPKWATNSTNSTSKGTYVQHSVNWTDDTALAGYIFSFDNGNGTLVNDSWVSMTGTQNWSNVTKSVNTTVGATIQWKIYANDSSNAWNSTDTFSYVTTNDAPTQEAPSLTPSPTANVTNNLTCTNQSTADVNGDSVTNIYNWLVNGSSILLLNLPFDTNVSTGGADVIKDYSTYGNNGTTEASGHPTWSSSGKIGGAYSFNTTQYINISANSNIRNLTDFTIDFWINVNVFGSQYIFNNYNVAEYGSGVMWIYSQDTSGLRSYVEGVASQTYTGIFSTGTWTHIAFVMDAGNNYSGYKNGVLNNTDTSVSSGPFLYAGVDTNFRIGMLVDGTNGFNGSIDNFRIWNRTLTSTEIQQLYDDSKNGYSNFATIVTGNTQLNDNWTCQIIPNDGLADGTLAQNSTSITSPPTAPPNVTLNSPSNGGTVYDGISFNCSATDDSGLKNLTLYGNWSGSWQANQSVNITGTSNSTVFNVPLPDGTYLWSCLVYDSDPQSDWADANWSVVNDQCQVTQISSSTSLTKDDCVYYNITANDVSLNCANHNIRGNNTDTLWGIKVNNKSGVTIQNCRMQNYTKGIYLYYSNNSVIQNNTLYNLSDVSSEIVTAIGIQLDYSYNNTLTGNNITLVWANSSSTTSCYNGYSYGVFFNNSYNNSLVSSTIDNVHGYKQGHPGEVCDANQRPALGYNIYSYYSDNVTINGSTIRDGMLGIYVSTSNYDDISYNNFSDMDISGIYIYQSDYGLIKSNSFSQAGASVYFPIGSDYPDIFNNNISYGTIGIYLAGIGGEIVNNTIQHTYSSEASEGAITLNGINLESFKGNKIINDTHNGDGGAAIYITYPTTTLEDVNITDSYRGIWFVTGSKNSTVYNSTLSGITNWSVYVSSVTNISFFNTSFDASKIGITSPGTFFNYYWLWVNVTDQNIDPLSASVNITDAFNQLSQTTTAANGLTSRLTFLEFNQTSSARTNVTPYNVTAYKTGYSTNSTNTTLTQSQTVWLLLNTPYILAYVPTTDVFSIAEPSNQTFSIAYSNATPVTIKWFVNGTEQTSYVNKSQFIWIGNFTQSGTYQIKVNVSNEVGVDDQIWTMTVNDTAPKVGLSWIYPTGNISVPQNSFFNVSLNVTCNSADCGTINLSLFSNNTLINTTAGATPFYTNSSANPQTTDNLNFTNSQAITFWINATGEVNSNYSFFSTANLTSNLSINNITSVWNITIAPQTVSVAIDLSPRLLQQINWSLASLPAYNQSAEGNNNSGISEYYVNISVTGGTADLYVKANGDLMTLNEDVLGLGNETYSYNSTNSSVPSSVKTSLTISYAKIGDGLTDGTILYLKFFLNAPSAQASGSYNNSLYFKGVPSGQTP